MAARVSRGRQRIPMRRIETHDDLYATFSKRRLGLYKKASELSTLCGVDVGVIIFSPTNNPFSFWHPSPESVIMRHTNPYMPLDAHTLHVESETRARIEYLNGRLDGLLDEKERLKDRESQINEAGMIHAAEGRWEDINVDMMDDEQVRRWKEWYMDLNSKLKDRLNELEVEASIYSAAFGLENVAEFPGAAAAAVGPGMYPQGQVFNQAPPAVEPSTRVMNMPPTDQQAADNYYAAPQPTAFGGAGPSQIPENYRYYPEDQSNAGFGGASTSWGGGNNP